jgi:2-hydroxycyclohexanecarboxyl-CoA dehydrogenase
MSDTGALTASWGRLRDRVAVITGAASGIGRAIAHRFAAEGASVAVLDLDLEGAEAVTAEIEQAGGRAVALRADVSSGDEVRAAVAAARTLGPIDILVSNAGWEQAKPFVQTDEALWDRLLAINLKGHLLCARAVLDEMIERRSGRIIFTASDAGRVGSSGEAVYSGAKGGVIAFAKTLARETARHGLNVNVVCPGPTETRILDEMAADHPRLVESLRAAIPFRRFARPDEIAGAFVFFASDDAAYITGQTLSVNGGLTML